jgi:uncharacterized small protein (DUF1192 family)
LSDEPTREEVHAVDNAEADEVIEACKRAIPHNEWLGRLVRNMYGRIQALEQEIAELKAKKPKRSDP